MATPTVHVGLVSARTYMHLYAYKSVGVVGAMEMLFFNSRAQYIISRHTWLSTLRLVMNRPLLHIMLKCEKIVNQTKINDRIIFARGWVARSCTRVTNSLHRVFLFYCPFFFLKWRSTGSCLRLSVYF